MGSNRDWEPVTAVACVFIYHPSCRHTRQQVCVAPGRSPGSRITVLHRPSPYRSTSGTIDGHSPHTVAGAALASDPRLGRSCPNSLFVSQHFVLFRKTKPLSRSPLCSRNQARKMRDGVDRYRIHCRDSAGYGQPAIACGFWDSTSICQPLFRL